MSLQELETAVQQLPEFEPLENSRPPAGLYRGQVNLPTDFDAPLPEEILRAFEGA